MNGDNRGQAAVYVGWTTFANSLDSLAIGIPNVIDKSVFPGQSGGVQSQIMAGLKFLGLIDDDGKPSAQLHALATTDESARKAALKKILQERYADLFALDLTKATSAQLYEKMAEAYNVTGDTREKAVRFFLAAVKYAELPLGRFLHEAKAATGGATRKRRPTGKARDNGDDVGDGDEDEPPPPAKPATGTSKTITLKSGHTLTVSTTAGLFDTGEDDRKFLFDLIDKLIAYERANEQAD